MAKKDTPEAITASYPNPRVAMGTAPVTSVRNASANTAKQGTRPHNYGGSGDPTVMAAPGHSVNPIPAETLGARYKITVGIPAPADPVAGQTLANGRIIPSVINRTSPDFAAGSNINQG